jgi:hypothetical protein
LAVMPPQSVLPLMNQARTILLKLFNIQEREGNTVLLLFSHHFLQGFGLALVFIVANTLFLSEYSVKELPKVYILSGFLVLFAGRVYAWFEHHMDIKKLLKIVVFISFLLLTLLWLSNFLINPAIFAFTLLAFYQVLYLIYNLEFWGLSALVFDVRQSKRLFGLISAGDMPAKMLGYLIVSVLAPILPLKMLIVLSAITILGSIYFLQKLLNLHQLHDENTYDIHHQYALKNIKTGPEKLLKKFFKNRFISIAALLSLIVIITLALINFSFLSEVKYKFKTDAELAAFFGLFFAAGQFITIFFKAFFSGRFIHWLGVKRGLLALPLSIVLIIGFELIFQFFDQNVKNLLYIYGFLMLTTDIINYALHQPLFLSLFQPMNAHLRLHGHTVIKGFVDGIGLIVAGSGILLLIHLGTSNKLMNFGLVILAFAVVWIAWVFITEKAYVSMLKNAIRIRRLSGSTWKIFDDRVNQKILEKITQGKPWEVIYHLELLKSSNSRLFAQYIVRAVSSQDKQISDWAINHIPDRVVQLKMPELKKLALSSIENEKPIYNLIKRIAATDAQAFEWSEAILNSGDTELTRVLIEGLLKGKSIEGMVLAGNKLIQLRDSALQRDRLLTCSIIENLELSNFHNILNTFLQEKKDHTLFKKAILTATNLKIKELQQAILELFDEHVKQSWYLKAIAKYGESTIQYFIEVHEQNGFKKDELDSLIYIAGRVPGINSTDLLLKPAFLESATLRAKALNVISGFSNNKIFGLKGDLVADWLYDESKFLETLLSYKKLELDIPLSKILDLEIRNTRLRIFDWLHLVYPNDDIPSKRNAYCSHFANKKANALENLDRLFNKQHKLTLLPLFEHNSKNDDENIGKDEIIRRLMNHGTKFISPWSFASCIQMLNKADSKVEKIIKSYKNSEWKVIKEQVDFYLNNENTMKTMHNTGDELMELEKVSILKNTALFNQTPEDLLIDLAEYVKTVRLEKEETLFKEGDPGDAMFIIHSGTIEIRDKNRVLATFGELDFFGELSLLDDESRSATAIAREESLLLSISQDDFYELITFRTEVAKSILRVLSQRLRKQNKS